jgi:hypothetical protein
MHDGWEDFFANILKCTIWRGVSGRGAALSRSETARAIKDPPPRRNRRVRRPPPASRDGMGRVQVAEGAGRRVILALHGGVRSAKRRRGAPRTSAYHLGNGVRKSAPGETRIHAPFLENSLSGRGFFRMLGSGRSGDTSGRGHTNKYCSIVSGFRQKGLSFLIVVGFLRLNL